MKSEPKTLLSLDILDGHAPRKPRPLGRGQGELFKNGYLPYREIPPFRAGEASQKCTFMIGVR
jgi:hypothetical protein